MATEEIQRAESAGETAAGELSAAEQAEARRYGRVSLILTLVDMAVDVIYLAVNDFFVGKAGAFIDMNLKVGGYIPKLTYTSIFLLLVTANGIFEPLEVALNRAWGVATNRSYLRNQAVSLGLILACGGFR